MSTRFYHSCIGKCVKRLFRSWFWLLLGGLLIGGVVYSLLPQPVEVEWAELSRGPMQVTINQTGMTRVRDRYEVSSPVAGQLLRITHRSGDPIRAAETLLAVIRPSDPSMLDARQVAETEARAAAAKLAVDRADARLDQSRVARELAENQLNRIRHLRQSGSASLDEFEFAEAQYRSRSDEFRVASFELEIARFEHQQALAALMTVRPTDTTPATNFEIRSPIDGAVLRVFQESSTVVTPGMALLEVGNPRDLEVIVDVLSTDAVKVSPGDEIRLVHWGGDKILKAKVRVVEPAAFTKISALGVEEQRVNVLGDFENMDESAARLGDGYRVEAEIVVWQSDNVLQVPTAALFRIEGRWCVFVIEQGVARQRIIEVGHRNPLMGEVLSGLTEGDRVVVYPSDLVKDGVRVETNPL